MKLTVQQQTEEEEAPPKVETVKVIPEVGTIDWIHYRGEFEGQLPSPIDVSITGSMVYHCPELKWYNYDVYPHKIKLTNTGYTVILGAKWKTERPYLEGGCFREKHVLSQVHFHWGADMTEGSDHTVDQRRYPGEMQVTYFRSEYITQEEALRHDDGVVVICYIIKVIIMVMSAGRRPLLDISAVFFSIEYGVNPDIRMERIIEGFPRIREAQNHTRIGPYPMSQLMPMFHEDYFLYWGSLRTVRGESHTVRWLVPRITLFASFEQMKQFRKLWDPWDEPNMGNYRELQDRGDRHVWFINPHWNQYNSTLPIPRVPEPSISVLSQAYRTNLWMLPKQNDYMIAEIQVTEKEGEKLS